MEAAVCEHVGARDLAEDLDTIGDELRASLDASVRRVASVRFTGLLAQLLDRRLRAHIAELNAILTSLGVATDDLWIVPRQDGEPPVRRPSSGCPRERARPGSEERPPKRPPDQDRHVDPDRDPGGDGDLAGGQALPAQYRRLFPLVLGAARHHGVDPALILAIMDRETGDPGRIGFGGRDPSATNGDDFGLMQINRAAHPAFFDENDWRDPAQNLDYGASVIAANLRHYDGDIARAAAAYNAGPGAVDRALRAGRSPDSVTTGGDYGSDVARRHAHFERLLGRD
jgi:Transglycosylase SLT domain